MNGRIQLHYFPSPNGRKVSIALEEMGLVYDVVFVDIMNGDQTGADFLELSPNGRIPALVDVSDDGASIKVFESGAILQYLARKTGCFYGVGEAQRCWIDGWVFWQMSGLGPMTGQVSYFARAAANLDRNPRDSAYPIRRYLRETRRLYAVLARQLSGRDFICDDYSIADMVSWPWIDQYHTLVCDITDYPDLARWYARIRDRPAVQRALRVASERVAGRPQTLFSIVPGTTVSARGEPPSAIEQAAPAPTLQDNRDA